jgi:hypothetical protein
VGGFAEELHGTRAKACQHFKFDRAKCVNCAVLVREVVPALVGALARRGMAGGACGRADVRSSERVDVGYVREHMDGFRAQVAVTDPVHL